MTTATRGSVSTEIKADPNRVYDLVSDVTRIGQRSPECYRVEWLDGATQPVEGARFKGYNKLGPLKWSTTCEVTSVAPGAKFEFCVVDGTGRAQTRWTSTVAPTVAGCTVSESYEFLWCPLIARLAELPFPRDRQLRRGIAQTLAAIKREAEGAR